MENSGYKTQKKNLNKRRRAERRRRARTQANNLDRKKIVPVLGAIEKVPENAPISVPENVPRGHPRIVRIEALTNKVKLVAFKKGRRVKPPLANENKRDSLICNKCKKNYKSEFCRTCFIIRYGFKSGSVPLDEELEYVPLTEGYPETQ